VDVERERGGDPHPFHSVVASGTALERTKATVAA
jgi:hypothetical protein